MTDAAVEFWNERSAVREFDGGAPREEAEALAIGDVAIKYGWPAAVGITQGEQNVERTPQS